MMHHLRIPILLLALLAWLPSRLLAQTLDPAFHIPAIYGEATVKDAVQMPNGQFVVAGDFTRINGQAGSGLARFDAAGVEDQVFRQNLGAATVWAGKLLPMPNGQLLVQGRYQNGATQRNYLFRLNANGTLDPTFNVAFSGSYPAPEVREMLLQADGRILIRGDFTTNANAEIVRLQSDGTLDPSFSVSLTYGSQVNQMLLQPDGKIILGGPFTWLNGSRAFFVARLNTNGSTDTSFQNQAYTNAPLYVNSIALTANGSVVVGGYAINVVGGQSVSIFRLLPTGALDPGFAVPASVAGRDCQRLVVTPNGQVAVLQSTYSTLSQTGARFDAQLVRLQANGALDAAFQPGSGPDWALSELRGLPNGNLLTWGYTSNFSGQRRTLSLLQPTGALETTFAPLLQVPGNVRKVVRQADGKLLIAGYFNSIDGHLTDRIARLLPDGQPDLNFAWRQPNSASWTLAALAVQADSKVLVAGNTLNSNIYTANGSPEEPVFARLTTSGLADPGFVPAIPLTASSPRSRIQLLAEQVGGQIIVGGTFTDAAGKANLTRLLANGSVEPTFVPPAAQPAVYSGLVQANGSIVCVVPVTGANYSQTLQRLLPGGNPDPAFAYTPPAQASQGLPYTGLDRVYQVSATGDYVTSGVLGATRVLARAAASGADVAGFTTPFQPIAGPALAYSGVNAVAAQADGRLVVGGYMQQSSQFGAPATLLARLEANGQLDATFSTSLITNPTGTPVFERYSVSDVLVQPDGAIVAGGYFLQAAGQPATGLVRFLPAGVLAVRTAKENSRIQAWPVPAHDVLHLQLEASARPQRVCLLDAMGKTVISQETTAADLTLNTAALAPGLYVLRVDYTSGPATRRIVVE
jgi:uncharacterized delta-60 repeat protein